MVEDLFAAVGGVVEVAEVVGSVCPMMGLPAVFCEECVGLGGLGAVWVSEVWVWVMAGDRGEDFSG